MGHRDRDFPPEGAERFRVRGRRGRRPAGGQDVLIREGAGQGVVRRQRGDPRLRPQEPDGAEDGRHIVAMITRCYIPFLAAAERFGRLRDTLSGCSTWHGSANFPQSGAVAGVVHAGHGIRIAAH